MKTLLFLPIAIPDKKRLPAPHHLRPIKSMKGIVSRSWKGTVLEILADYLCIEISNRG